MSTHPASRLAQRTARTVAAGLLTVAIAASPALAQRAQGFASPVRPAVTAMDAIGVSLARGFQLSAEGRYDHEAQAAAPGFPLNSQRLTARSRLRGTPRPGRPVTSGRSVSRAASRRSRAPLSTAQPCST